MLPMFFSRRWWWTTLLVLAGIALAIRLGFWQLDRNAQRQALVSHNQAMLNLPVLDLNQSPLPSDMEAMEYRQVIVLGEYDFEHQVALRNQARQRMTGTDPGVALVTPLKLSNGSAVLVERGWIPLEHSNPASWRQYDEPGLVRVEGVIRRSMEKADYGSALVDPTLAPGQARLETWNFVNLPRLQEQIPYTILNIYIQQAEGENRDTLPYRLAEAPDLDPGTHMGFALQWFIYAGVLFFGYPVWLKKQIKR